MRSRRRCCIFPLATWSAGATAASWKNLPKNYTPRGIADFDAVKEWQSLENLIRETEARADSPEVTEELRRTALKKEHAAKDLQGAALGKSDPQEPRALAAPDSDRRRHRGAPTNSAGPTPTRSRKAFPNR